MLIAIVCWFYLKIFLLNICCRGNNNKKFVSFVIYPTKEKVLRNDGVSGDINASSLVLREKSLKFQFNNENSNLLQTMLLLHRNKILAFPTTLNSCSSLLPCVSSAQVLIQTLGYHILHAETTLPPYHDYSIICFC